MIVICPFFVSFKCNYDSFKKEAKFSVRLLDLIKITSAKIFRSHNGLIIKFSERKSKKISLLSFDDVKGIIKPFKDFHITSCKIFVYKSGNDLISLYETAFIYNFLLNIILPEIVYRKPFFKPKSNIVVSEGINFTQITLSVNILLNLVVVLGTLIKSVWGIISGK